MLDLTKYITRYKKDDFADHLMYRAYDNAMLECAQCQINDHANLVSDDLIWSSTSLLECKIKHEHSIVFMQEALLKTYPTKMLTKAVAQCLCKKLDIQQCLVSLSLQGTKLAQSSQLVVYDLDIGKFIEWTPSSGLSYNAMLKCDGKNIENSVAGRIVYKLGMKTNDKQYDISRFESAAQDLVDHGQRLGYDYMAQSTQYDEAHRILICYVMYEAKFQDSTIEVKDDLYHIAPISVAQKIMKFGLSPKSKTYISGEKVCHSDRVYLFNGFDESVLSKFVLQLEKMSSSYDKLKKMLLQTKEYALFKIDRSKVPNLKLYRDNNFQAKDPRHPTALYTYSNIPPNAIEFIDYAKVK